MVLSQNVSNPHCFIIHWPWSQGYGKTYNGHTENMLSFIELEYFTISSQSR